LKKLAVSLMLYEGIMGLRWRALYMSGNFRDVL
jgi:hypothetical protein